ncbi:MAG TPA: hypothetical protein VM253_00965 [Candidatus Limnocylindrales bacterium]|nr:hypothetical protein [Candidatus Limnocylindrales bacterium]
MSVVHRVRLPVGATPLVEVGHEVEPAEVLATRRPPGEGTSVPVAAVLRRSAEAAATCLAVSPGTVLEDGDLLAADTRGREVRVPHACLFLSYDLNDGAALVAPLQGTEPIVGHVRGEVTRVEADAIEIRVGGAMVAGVGGSGGAVHGELRLAVRDPADELRASAIDVGTTGRILVGGSRASAETLTRARAMGVAGIVLGGVLDKELRDFEATQARRREIGGARGDFGVLLLEGFGKVGFDPHLFAWFQAHEGRVASLFGAAAQLYVYDAGPPPARRVLARPGDRVVAHRRPYAGMAGELLRVADGLQVTTTGIPARAGIVRFEDGLTAVVPLANLEAAEPRAGG